MSAFDHLTLAIRSYHDSGDTTTIRVPRAVLVALVALLFGRTMLPMLGGPCVYGGGQAMRCCACVVVALVAWSSAVSWQRKLRPFQPLLEAVGGRL